MILTSCAHCLVSAQKCVWVFLWVICKRGYICCLLGDLATSLAVMRWSCFFVVVVAVAVGCVVLACFFYWLIDWLLDCPLRSGVLQERLRLRRLGQGRQQDQAPHHQRLRQRFYWHEHQYCQGRAQDLEVTLRWRREGGVQAVGYQEYNRCMCRWTTTALGGGVFIEDWRLKIEPPCHRPTMLNIQYSKKFSYAIFVFGVTWYGYGMISLWTQEQSCMPSGSSQQIQVM